MRAEEWLKERLPGVVAFPKKDAATRAFRTESLFIKFFPYELSERAAIEAEIASGGWHSAIIPSLLASGCDDGMVLVYPWVAGECLGAVEARERFYALPERDKALAIATLFAACAAIAERGFVLVDLYEGNLIYDFDERRLMCFDWDLCVRGESFILEQERNWGSSRLMSPEEFVRGSVIDARSNVFTLGRIGELALGESDVFRRATDPDPARRFSSVRALADALVERYSDFS